MSQASTVKDVYTIQESEGGSGDGAKDRWTKIGIGFVNRDDSINILLNALPVNGRLHVRERNALRRQAEAKFEGESR